jgi:hypothetical protein
MQICYFFLTGTLLSGKQKNGCYGKAKTNNLLQNQGLMQENYSQQNRYQHV